MQQHPIYLWPKTNEESDHWLRKLGDQHPRRRCAEAAYAAFHREHQSHYSKFAATITGSASVGRHLARAALTELAVQWLVALRSTSPSGFAWTLLAETLGPHRTDNVRVLYRNLRTPEADALLLRHRLGCSVLTASRLMGLTPDAFELLRRRALANAVSIWHMPASDAI
ncbi:hypothetical protein [Streptomyces rubradiris]|uniref:hypothetical protein n=1 Tax=Streptomyces rubradiris TaxID=285531 RepID=UPI00167A7AD9|nr:hypothetical protein [Streptomyces rubradiris]